MDVQCGLHLPAPPEQRRPCGPAQHQARVLEEAVDDEEAVPNVVVQDLLGPLGSYCQQGQLAARRGLGQLDEDARAVIENYRRLPWKALVLAPAVVVAELTQPQPDVRGERFRRFSAAAAASSVRTPAAG